MTAKTVGFAISDDDRPLLEELVEHYGQGNRSEFLRVAMKRLKRDRIAEKLAALQAEVRGDLAGRVVSQEEVTAAVKLALRSQQTIAN